MCCNAVSSSFCACTIAAGPPVCCAGSRLWETCKEASTASAISAVLVNWSFADSLTFFLFRGLNSSIRSSLRLSSARNLAISTVERLKARPIFVNRTLPALLCLPNCPFNASRYCCKSCNLRGVVKTAKSVGSGLRGYTGGADCGSTTASGSSRILSGLTGQKPVSRKPERKLALRIPRSEASLYIRRNLCLLTGAVAPTSATRLATSRK